MKIALCITEILLLQTLSFNELEEILELSPTKLQCSVISLERIVAVYGYLAYKIHPKPGLQTTMMTTWARYKNEDGYFIHRGIILSVKLGLAYILVPCLWRHASSDVGSISVIGLPMKLKGRFLSIPLVDLEISSAVVLTRENSKTTIEFELAMFNEDGYLYGNYGCVDESK